MAMVDGNGPCESAAGAASPKPRSATAGPLPRSPRTAVPHDARPGHESTRPTRPDEAFGGTVTRQKCRLMPAPSHF
jgi:hypothetical protein